MPRNAWFRLLPAVLLGAVVSASAAVAQTDSAAHYTKEQAKRGNIAFRQKCGSCHATAEFKGAFFMNRWSAGNVYQLFDFLRTQMPIDNPGSLSAEEYVGVIAYLLELNGLANGDSELPADPDALRALIIAPPRTQEP